MSRRKRAAALATAGGALLLVGGATGSAGLWPDLLALAARAFPEGSTLFALARLALLVLAAGGGITVLIGASLLRRGFWDVGRFVVGIGCGAGLLDVALKVLVVWIAGGDPFQTLGAIFSGVAGIGLALAILATLA